MENADVARIINSDEVQSVLRPKLEAPKKYSVKKNPLKNIKEMEKLNANDTGESRGREVRVGSQRGGRH